MACGNPSGERVYQITLPISFEQSRLAICNKCEHGGESLVCLLVEAAKPGKAIIADGVKRAALRCPLNRWRPIRTKCNGCGRSEVIGERSGVCRWCEMRR